MAIPNVNLNVDPRGYAGGISQRIPVYGGQGGGGGGGHHPLLARIMAMRERQAEAELQMMQAQMAEPGKQRAWDKKMWELQNYVRRQDEAKEQRRMGGERMRAEVGPHRADTSKIDDYMKAYRMANALVGPGSVGGAGQKDPAMLQRLTGMIGAIGPQGAHEGLMQTGRLQAGMRGAFNPFQGAGAAQGPEPAADPRFIRNPGGTGMPEPSPAQWQDVSGLRGMGRQRGAGSASYSNIYGQPGWDPDFAPPRSGAKSSIGFEKGTPFPRLSGRRSQGKSLGSYQGGTGLYGGLWNAASQEAQNALATNPNIANMSNQQRRSFLQNYARTSQQAPVMAGAATAPPVAPVAPTPAAPGGLTPSQQYQQDRQWQTRFGGSGFAPGTPGAAAEAAPGGATAARPGIDPASTGWGGAGMPPPGPPAPAMMPAQAPGAPRGRMPMAPSGPPPVGAAPDTIPGASSAIPGAPPPGGGVASQIATQGPGGTPVSAMPAPQTHGNVQPNVVPQKPSGAGEYGITTPQGPVRKGNNLKNTGTSTTGSFAEGGGVPETGTYKLHKGEMVIPTKDVDEDLVNYMVRKKIYDRAYKKGKGSPLGSYQGGTLDDLFKLAETGDTAAFREILRGEGMPDDEITRVVSQNARGTGGRAISAAQRGKNFKTYFKSSAMVPSGLGGAGVWAGQPGPSPPAQLPSGMIPPERSMVPSQAPRSMVPPVKGPGIHTPPGYPRVNVMPPRSPAPSKMLGAGAKAGGGYIDDLVRLLSKAPGWLKGAGAVGAGALGAYGLSQMEPGGGPPPEEIPEELRSTAKIPESLADMPEAIGGRLREVMGGILGPIAEGVGGFARGLTGVGEEEVGEPAPTGPPDAPLPTDKAIQDLAGAIGEEPAPEGSYEAAAARVGAGDFGTRENPLVLRGQLSDIEQAQRDVERLPMYQEAKRKGDLAEKEANAIFNMLAKEGRAMSPEVYKDLAQEADRKMKLAKSFQTVTERQEKTTQAMLVASEKSTQAIIKELTKQGAMESRQMNLEELKQRGRLTSGTMRGFANSLPGLYRAAATGTYADRARAEDQIAQIFKVMMAYRESVATSAEERNRYRQLGAASEQYAEEYSKLSAEEAEAMAQSLLTTFSATGELQDLMGGAR